MHLTIFNSNQNVFYVFRMNMSKILRTYTSTIPELYRSREVYATIKKTVLDNISEFMQRIGKNSFHGGDKPDEADFAMYALIKSYSNSFSFRKFIENDFGTVFNSWYIRMQVLCKYEENRFYTEEATTA